MSLLIARIEGDAADRIEAMAEFLDRPLALFADLGARLEMLLQDHFSDLDRSNSNKLGATRTPLSSLMAPFGADMSVIDAKECIDYVPVYELCHLKHQDHSTGCYTFPESVLSDWLDLKHKLEQRMA